MQPIKTYTANGKTLNIYSDDNAESPREWDNLGKMICFHRRYNLGDKHDYRCEDYNGWEEMKQAIIKNEKPAVILPLYLYDHSGITISTKPFGCRWDSGQIGFIIITKEALRKEFNKKRISVELIAKATEIAENEVKIYDDYITGEVYMFTIEDEKGEQIDSCGGFLGSDLKTNGLTDYIEDKELANLVD